MKRNLKRILAVSVAFCLMFAMSATASAASITLMPSGYTIEVGENAPIQSENSYHYGGNMNLFTFDDFTDLAAYPEAEEAVNWWLSCGVTNGGKTFTEFGAEDEFYRYDLAYFLYRYYSIVNDDGMWFYDDVPINQMGSTIGLKFNDAVTNVRWSGIMGGIGARSEANADPVTGLFGASCFDPFGSVTTESLLVTLYRLINYEDGALGANHPDVMGETTMQVNTNFGYTVEAVAAEDAAAYLGDAKVSSWAESSVAAMVKEGLYAIEAGADLTAPLTKIEVIQALYDICAGTGGRHVQTEAYVIETDATTIYEEDTAITGADIFLGGAEEALATNGLVIRNGAEVTIDDSTITYGKIKSAIPYPIAYRWGHCADMLVYGEGSRLTITGSDLVVTEESSFAHQAVMGLEVQTGGVAHLIECNTILNTSGLLCYDGTLIYEKCALLATGRVTSSDFFSGITIYDGTTVNKGTDTVAGGFMDEAATTYVVGSEYFGAGSGNQTGVSSFYAYDSTMVMSATSCTNNTSMLSDVSSTILENCDVTYTGGIASVVREGKLVLKYIDCGEVKLGELGEGEYDISITGTEYGSFSAVRVYLDGSSFSRALKVYVANGCELEIIYTGEAPVVEQDTSATKTVSCFANTELKPSEDTTNTGLVTLTKG